MAHEMTRTTKIANLGAVVVPFLATLAAIVLFWNRIVSVTDLAILAVMYLLTATGITVGYHRLLTHRSFRTHKPTEYLFALFGSMAVQGSAITWAVDHRTHHAHSDKEGDPHSPHHGFARGPLGALKGLLHAHMGWMFRHNRSDQERYGKDILQDRLTMTVSRLFPLWAVLTFVVPFALGGLLTLSWKGAVTGLVWGGLVRLFFNHHVTWSVNSICHFFGKRPFATSDQSTNNWMLALPSLGESWHHNHHVFPTSAFHGLSWRQVDLSAWVIAGWEKIGLVRNVRKPTSEQIVRKLTPSAHG